MATLAAVVALGGPVALVIGLTAVASAAGSAEKPAAMALLPRVVGESRLGPANALLHTVQQLGLVVGPAIGALLLAVGPAWIAFSANGATFAASALLISTVHRDVVSTRRGSAASRELLSGLQAMRSARYAIWLTVAIATVEFTYGAQTVQLVVYASKSLGLGRGGYGVLLGATGAGGVLSALVNGTLSTSRRVTLVVLGTAALSCATQLAYAGVDVIAIALAVTVLGGAGLVSSEVVGETVLARVVPREALGRVIGIFDAASVAAMVSGALLAPALIAVTSLRISLAALGAACVLVIIAARFRLGGLDALSAQRADALASKVNILKALPVMVGVQQIVLEQLAADAQLCPLPPGVDVVVQGAPAHAFYAVADGQVVVHRDGAVRDYIGPGGGFGERGLLDNAPRNATVTTETNTELLRIEGTTLLEALERAPSLRPALDRSNAPSEPAPEATHVVDDPAWVEA
jgi:MFS family permease